MVCYGDSSAAARAIDTVRHSLDQALAELVHLTRSSAKVAVGTVYDPSDGTGDAARLGLPPWEDALEMLAALNGVLRDVAGRHGAAVAEIHNRFLGHGLSRGDPAQPDARPADRNLWYCNLIEPNAWGRKWCPRGVLGSVGARRTGRPGVTKPADRPDRVANTVGAAEDCA